MVNARGCQGGGGVGNAGSLLVDISVGITNHLLEFNIIHFCTDHQHCTSNVPARLYYYHMPEFKLIHCYTKHQNCLCTAGITKPRPAQYCKHDTTLKTKQPSGMEPPRPRSRSEGAIRATLTRTPSVSSLLRARRAVFPPKGGGWRRKGGCLPYPLRRSVGRERVLEKRLVIQIGRVTQIRRRRGLNLLHMPRCADGDNYQKIIARYHRTSTLSARGRGSCDAIQVDCQSFSRPPGDASSLTTTPLCGRSASSKNADVLGQVHTWGQSLRGAAAAPQKRSTRDWLICTSAHVDAAPPRSMSARTTVAERLARSPLTKANRVQSPDGTPYFRKWESCQTMPFVGGFSRGSHVSPAPLFRRRSIFTLIALIGSQDLAVKSRPNLSNHSTPEAAEEKYKLGSFRDRTEITGARRAGRAR
ncbi:hypothetical protein PR048_016932 [Dryococelus australis]|uniref:Uncharacterized protein n=1 Tax=Dryococelus australis TaxID=614101 RepID=A0ABQ9H860_9NEOP|nr:hypothetical protein PR048_016932 [Dryococelus australis]